MKNFILFLLFTIISTFAAEHEIVFAPKQGKNFIIFVDLNTNFKERQAAMNAAKKLNLGFAMIPSLSTAKKIEMQYYNFLQTDEKLDYCRSNPDKCDNKELLEQQRDDFKTQCEEIALGNSFNLDTELESLSKTLVEKKYQVTHFVVSGHHGSCCYYGDFLCRSSTSMETMFENLKYIPNVTHTLKFLGLWGCDSINHDLISSYINTMPNLKVIAGFYDTAPRGTRAYSHQLLSDLLMGAYNLTQSESSRVLKQRIKSLRGSKDTYSGIFVRIKNKEDFFYYNEPLKERENEVVIKNHFDSLSERLRCNQFMENKFYHYHDLIAAYYDGEKEIPTNTSRSELRDAYYDLTQNIDCYRDELSSNRYRFLSANTLGLLRFYYNVKGNFIRSHKKLINAVDEFINTLPENDALKIELKNIFPISILETLKLAGRPAIIELNDNLQTLVKAVYEGDKTKNLYNLSILIDRLLVNLDEECMDYMEWHVEPRTLIEPPVNKCPLE